MVIISSLFRLPVGVIPVSDQSAAYLFVLWFVFKASRSGEVMISPFAFQVRSLQRLVKLETELARQTACRAQVKQLRSEKLSPCSRGNRSDSNDWASTTLSWPLSSSKVLFLETPKTGTILILLPEIKDYSDARAPFLCFLTEQNTVHFQFSREFTHACEID